MGFSIFYALFFWITWISVLAVILKAIPAGAELIAIVIYAILGVALYFFIPTIVNECLGGLQAKKYKENNRKIETKNKFLNEQRLRERYKYIKLNKKEDIIASNIDKRDKIALLEITHGDTAESAQQLIKEYENKTKEI